ncbi:MAG: dephospho-CoA kinase [Propionicimonas sp.]|uniref:dephospho-CoA kinase n=1 Tax=Propionicimonas sp. TaxID=1955623 RepID=UPI003D131749
MTESSGILVGLTGGIASGKSTVAELLAERGALVIDADRLAREVVEPGTPGLAAVVARFGDGVLRPDGSLDRPALGRIVFADTVARGDLEAIIHPAVRARAAELTAAAPAGAVVVQMIPLLVETGQQDAFDLVVVVDTAPEEQLARVRARDGLGAEEALARVRAQADRERRLAAADVVLHNDGTPADLADQVDRFWTELTGSPGAEIH